MHLEIQNRTLVRSLLVILTILVFITGCEETGPYNDPDTVGSAVMQSTLPPSRPTGGPLISTVGTMSGTSYKGFVPHGNLVPGSVHITVETTGEALYWEDKKNGTLGGVSDPKNIGSVSYATGEFTIQSSEAITSGSVIVTYKYYL